VISVAKRLLFMNNHHYTVQKLPDLCADFFSLIIKLRMSQDLGDPEELRKRITRMFGVMENKGKEIGINNEDILAAKYALSAFIDETILSSQWPARESWLKRPLQLEYFGTQLAGEEFFKKLEQLRQQADSRTDLLEVFYTCLSLGYEGRYKILGLDKLKMLIQEVGSDINRIRGREAKAISPHWKRSEGLVRGLSRELPPWVVFVVCLAMAFFLFLGLSIWIGHSADSVAKELQDLVGKI